MTSRTEVVTIRPRGLCEEAAAAYIGIGVSSLQKLVREGKIKKPRMVTARLVSHEVADLDEYMDSCPRSTHAPGPGRVGAT